MIMNEEFNKRYTELKETINSDTDAKIAELANKQTEQRDFSKSGLAVALQILATLSITVVGGIFTITNYQNQEKSRNTSMAIQLMANRENSETDFRRNMFQPMIDRIMDDSVPIKKRLEVFNVFQNNFHDLFNSRAIYDVLDDAIQHDSTINNNKKLLNDLRSLARQTSQDEELLIGGNYSTLDLAVGDTTMLHFKNVAAHGHMHEENHEESKCEKDPHKVWIKIEDIDSLNAYVKIRLTLFDNGNEMAMNNGEPFHVQYYDSPLTDNILLPDRHRIAVVLKDIYPHADSEDKGKPVKAKLKIIHFPADFITTGYRPSLSSVNKLLEK